MSAIPEKHLDFCRSVAELARSAGIGKNMEGEKKC